MNNSTSDQLSKGDIISLVALLILGVIVFFGMNFSTLGNKVPSILVAVLLCVFMLVFVFLAAYAKRQDYHQETWKMMEGILIVLYAAALIPSYYYTSKFLDIQFQKQEILQEKENDIEDINRLFADYTRRCESRSRVFQTELEALLRSDEGRDRMVRLLDLNKPASQVSQQDVNAAVESFSAYLLQNPDLRLLKQEKKELVQHCQASFNHWNLLLVPHDAAELGVAKERFADQLSEVYTSRKHALERRTPTFDTSEYTRESHLSKRFSESPGFSPLGLLATLVLGLLGLVKWLLGNRSEVIYQKKGEASKITQQGGFKIR